MSGSHTRAFEPEEMVPAAAAATFSPGGQMYWRHDFFLRRLLAVLWLP